MNPLDFLLRNPTGRDAGSIARQRLNARVRVPATGRGLLGPVSTLADLAYIVPKVFNPNDNIITSLQNLGTSIQNQFSTQTRGYVGSSPTAVAANQRRYRGVIGSIPPSADGESYRRAELRLADAARPGGGGGGGGNAGYSLNTFTGRSGMGSPEDRAYQSAKAETAAMVATDPLMQQWEKARQDKDYATADQLGKEIWQNRYGKTEMGRPGGAIGLRNPLMERMFPDMSRGAGEYTMGPSPLVPQVDPALNPAGPTYVLGEGPRLMNFSDEKITPEIIKAYQEQLLKQAAAK